MKIFQNSFITKKYKRAAVAIGNFDGVHKGHQKVFNFAKKFANKKSTKFGVFTFTPLPIMFFNKKLNNYKLTTQDQKFKLLKKNKVDFIVNIKFNKSFSKISAEQFIKNIIYKKINPKLLFVSNNFRFGNKRRGNVNLLKKFSQQYNYKLKKVSPLMHQKKIVSSTRIRKCLMKGNLKLANKLLSRAWAMEGQVIKGKKLGRKLGYRTCNMDIKNYILPKSGIYAVKAVIGNSNKKHKGIAYIGSRPTFGGKKILLETNIFNIKKNLYKKRLKIYFFKFIRGDKKFKNSRELIQQMNKDVILAKKGLKVSLAL